FQAEDGIRDFHVTGVQTCALPILGRRQLNHLWVEAGATLGGALFAAGLVNELVLYQAPMLMGNPARGLLALPEFTAMSQPPRLRSEERRVGKECSYRWVPYRQPKR